MAKKLVAYTDGSCYPPPNGRMRIGIVIVQDRKVVKEISEFLGESGTNNVAEYRAIMRAMEEAIGLGADELEIESDSQLVIRQLNGQYAIKKPHLKIFYCGIKSLESRFKHVTYRWIARGQNVYADRLSRAD